MPHQLFSMLHGPRDLTGRLLAHIHKITGQFWGPLVPLQPEAGSTMRSEQAAWGSIQLVLENLKGWSLHSLSRKPAPVLHYHFEPLFIR